MTAIKYLEKLLNLAFLFYFVFEIFLWKQKKFAWIDIILYLSFYT
jgi:hypothetical protein